MSRLALGEIGEILDGRWLLAPEDPGCVIGGVSIDTRELDPGDMFVALPGEQCDGHQWLAAARTAGAGLLLVDAARAQACVEGTVPMLAVPDPTAALWRLAEAWRARLEARVIGITGSAGKTTVRAMLQSILECAVGAASCTASIRSFNNHLGVPLTILRSRSSDAFLLLEIGTNAPGEIARLGSLAAPSLAIITNIGRAHLEGLGSMEGVAREKASLLACLPPDGTAIVPFGDARLDAAIASCLPEGVARDTFGDAGAGTCMQERRVLDTTGAQIIRLTDGMEVRLRLPGAHNARNALAAIAAARCLGIADRVIADGLADLTPDPMRLAVESIGDQGTMLFNDVYNANPAAVLASMEAFAEMSAQAPRRMVILGDMMELGDDAPALHEACGEALARIDARTPIEVAVLAGSHAGDTARGLAKTGFGTLIVRIPHLDDERIEAVVGLVQPGDAVLMKGSRGMHLERLVDALRANMGRLEREVAQLS